MFKLLFGFFLIMHVLGYFYFQGDKLLGKKQNVYKYVMFRSLIYFLVSFVCIIPFWSFSLLISVCALSVLNFAIDSIKFFYIKKKESNATVYIVDQLIHITFIAGAASVLAYTGYRIKLLPMIGSYLSFISETPKAILAWIGIILMSGRPANITIKQLVAKHKPVEKSFDNLTKAGAFIGTLERIIILLLLSVGQYSAIGLVLTAKSIARYNKISEDKQFAEYYLIGTLLSTLFAICTYFVFM